MAFKLIESAHDRWRAVHRSWWSGGLVGSFDELAVDEQHPGADQGHIMTSLRESNSQYSDFRTSAA
jgi:hypothetical protein